MLTTVKTIIILLAAGAAVVGLWGAGVEDGRLTWQGVVLLTLILSGAGFGIAEEMIRTRTERRELERRKKEKDAERHWSSLEAEPLLGLHVAVFVKTSVPAPRFIELLRGVDLHLDPEERQYLNLGEAVRFPQLNGESGSWERPPHAIDEAVAWLWMLYGAKAGYWWKSTDHAWMDPDARAAAVDAEIPWAVATRGNIASLRDLASIPRFGVTLPWELVDMGLEEVSLQFRTRTSSLDFEFSDHGLDGLAWLQREQRRAASQSGYLPLGISLPGRQALDDLRGAFIRRELGDNRAKPYRGIMGLSGPAGLSVQFFPEMPKEFTDNEASRQFSFTVTVAARD